MKKDPQIQLYQRLQDLGESPYIGEYKGIKSPYIGESEAVKWLT